MYKGLVSLAAVLSSSVLFASAAPITSCPNLNELNSIANSDGSTYTIAPGKLYSTQKIVQDSSGRWFSILVGPIKASWGDSAFDLAEHIVSRSAQEGHLELHNNDFQVCYYDSGVSGLYVSVTFGDSEDALRKQTAK